LSYFVNNPKCSTLPAPNACKIVSYIEKELNITKQAAALRKLEEKCTQLQKG